VVLLDPSLGGVKKLLLTRADSAGSAGTGSFTSRTKTPLGGIPVCPPMCFAKAEIKPLAKPHHVPRLLKAND
jgi:hypothetical protein